MPRARPLPVALATVAMLIIAACSDAVRPRALSGTYVLASIDGAGPPFTIWNCVSTNGARDVKVIAYDSMTFTSDSTMYRRRLAERTLYDTAGVRSGTYQDKMAFPGDFVRTDDGVVVRWRSSPDPFVYDIDTLRIDGRQLSVLRFVELQCTGDSSELQLAPFIYRQ